MFITLQSCVSGMGASTLLWNVFTGYLLYGEANMVDPGGVFFSGGMVQNLRFHVMPLPTTNRQRNTEAGKQTEETNTQASKDKKKPSSKHAKKANNKSCSSFRSMNYHISLGSFRKLNPTCTGSFVTLLGAFL